MLALNNADKLKYFTTQSLYIPDNQGGVISKVILWNGHKKLLSINTHFWIFFIKFVRLIVLLWNCAYEIISQQIEKRP